MPSRRTDASVPTRFSDAFVQVGCEIFFQFLEPDIQRVREPRLFRQHSLRNAVGGFLQFGIRILHQVAHRKDHLVQERLVWPSNRPCVIARRMILRST